VSRALGCGLAGALVVAAVTTTVGAQGNPQSAGSDATRESLRRATEAYQNLDARAMDRELARASAACRREHCAASLLARVLVLEGVGAVMLRHNAVRAQRAFRRALENDASVVPDPLLLTPEVREAFVAAGGQLPESSDAPIASNGSSPDAGPGPPSSESTPSDSRARQSNDSPPLRDTPREPTRDSGRDAGTSSAIARPRESFAHPWVVLDVGMGAGFPYVGGSMNRDFRYAEFGQYASNMPPSCGPLDEITGEEPLVCPPSLSYGFSVVYIAAANLRVNIVNRFGVAIGVRWQPDSARSTPLAAGARATLSSVVLSLRAHISLLPTGFSAGPFGLSIFGGTAVGQIQPAIPTTNSAGVPSSRPSAHVISGLNNVHLGLRGEVGLGRWMVLAAEFTTQIQFPAFLFALDTTALIGCRL